MRLVSSILLAGAAVADIKWFVKYGLTQDEITVATKAGCYRGTYGGVYPRSMSLLTCHFEDAEAIAVTEDDAFLCVVELANDQEAHGQALSTLNMHEGTSLLWTGSQEYIIGNSEKSSDKPHLCCPSHFEGVAHNVVYVPVDNIKPLDAVPMWHPRVRAVHEAIANNTALEADPRIVALVNNYDRQNVMDGVEWFSTDSNGGNTQITRNSYAIRQGRGGCAPGFRCSEDIHDDLEAKLRGYFATYTGQWTITRDRFRTDMCENIMLTIGDLGLGAPYIVTGAHFDSRNTNSGAGATGAAPGADDNASGSAVQLEMARVIAAANVQFTYPMRILWFCGEEQGLLGSRALARAYRRNGDNLIGMFNMDMVGYTRPNLPVVLSFMTGSASSTFSSEIKAFSQVYVPFMQVGDTRACCSDQQSFHAEGFRAAGIFETPTRSVVYPQYHRSGDTWDNGLINYDQVWNFGQGLFSAILEYAQIVD